ncbi:MAG: glycosyltransferase family 2 protein [Lachnospiraceae bacterium]|nr:glycosyltransferase family 2 protein [Lachnospiraceae bacterium]
MQVKEGLVSIMVPCFNGENYIERFFDSILSQSYTKIQLIFVDDGSTDRTEEIALSYVDRLAGAGMRMEYYRKENGGAASAINVALQHVQGEYCMWMDADDYLSKDHIGMKVKALSDNPDAQVVKCRGVLVRETDLTEIAKLGTEKSVGTLFEDVLFGYQSLCNGLYMVRTEALFSALNDRKVYETEVGQNFQLLLPVLYNGKIVEIQDEMFFYVMREESHSHNIHGLEHWKKRQDLIDEVKAKVLESIHIRMSDGYRKKIEDLLELHSVIMRFEDILREINYEEQSALPEYIRDIAVRWIGKDPKTIQKQCYIWGASSKGRQIEALLENIFDVRISGYIDSNWKEKTGSISPEQMDPAYMHVMVPLFYYGQVKETLDRKGFTDADVSYPREQLLRRIKK